MQQYLKLWKGHASVKHLSRPTIEGFGHPLGALEDGARGKHYFSEAFNFVELVRIRASNFGVENKCVWNILLYKSLQMWSWEQMCWNYTIV